MGLSIKNNKFKRSKSLSQFIIDSTPFKDNTIPQLSKEADIPIKVIVSTINKMILNKDIILTDNGVYIKE